MRLSYISHPIRSLTDDSRQLLKSDNSILHFSFYPSSSHPIQTKSSCLEDEPNSSVFSIGIGSSSLCTGIGSSSLCTGEFDDSCPTAAATALEWIPQPSSTHGLTSFPCQSQSLGEASQRNQDLEYLGNRKQTLRNTDWWCRSYTGGWLRNRSWMSWLRCLRSRGWLSWLSWRSRLRSRGWLSWLSGIRSRSRMNLLLAFFRLVYCSGQSRLRRWFGSESIRRTRLWSSWRTCTWSTSTGRWFWRWRSLHRRWRPTHWSGWCCRARTCRSMRSRWRWTCTPNMRKQSPKYTL